MDTYEVRETPDGVELRGDKLKAPLFYSVGGEPEPLRQINHLVGFLCQRDGGELHRINVVGEVVEKRILPAAARMENVRIRLQRLAVRRLQLAQLIRLAIAPIGRKMFVDEEVPDFFPALSRIEGFILRVTHTSKLLVRSRRLRAVALTDQLNHAFAVINLVAQDFSQIATLSSEDLLPDWLIAKKGQRISHKLPSAFQLTADCGNEH